MQDFDYRLPPWDVIEKARQSSLFKQSWETESDFRKRVVNEVRAQCTELVYEIETRRPTGERVKQMIDWLKMIAD